MGELGGKIGVTGAQVEEHGVQPSAVAVDQFGIGVVIAIPSPGCKQAVVFERFHERFVHLITGFDGGSRTGFRPRSRALG
ncbi:hypothetical protein LBMAG53_22550 [Planctomycetota bacterium]|nr:hypothetical protein LBMAG53_22550 [Planctomycetota bacterium]